jgi:glycerate dehydrogenase
MGSGSPPRIVFLDRETLSPQTRLREPSFPHRLDVFGKTAPAEVAQRIAMPRSSSPTKHHCAAMPS